MMLRISCCALRFELIGLVRVIASQFLLLYSGSRIAASTWRLWSDLLNLVDIRFWWLQACKRLFGSKTCCRLFALSNKYTEQLFFWWRSPDKGRCEDVSLRCLPKRLSCIDKWLDFHNSFCIRCLPSLKTATWRRGFASRMMQGSHALNDFAKRNPHPV